MTPFFAIAAILPKTTKLAIGHRRTADGERFGDMDLVQFVTHQEGASREWNKGRFQGHNPRARVTKFGQPVCSSRSFARGQLAPRD